MTKPARDYPTGMTPKQFAKLGARLDKGSWKQGLDKAAAKHGVDTTWSQENPYAVAMVKTIQDDFDTDADGWYAQLLVEAGLRDEDVEYDVGDY